MNDHALKRMLCLGCGFLYDEAVGSPEHGLAPGTRWEDIPDDWVCPECLVSVDETDVPFVETLMKDDAQLKEWAKNHAVQ